MSTNISQSSRSLRLDNRAVLGTLILALAWFVGTTFVTGYACLAYTVAAMLLGYAGEKWTLRRATLPGSGKLQRSLWGELWRAGILLFVMLGALVLIFMWRIDDRLRDTSSLLLLAVDTVAHYGISLLCILWAVWPRQGHATMMLIALVTVLMTVAGGGVSNSLAAQTAVGLVVVIGFVLAAQVIVVPRRFVTTANDERRLKFPSESWPYLLLTVSLFLIATSMLVHVTDRFLPNVQAQVFAQLRDRFESTDSAVSWAGGGYVSGGRLGSVQQRMLTDPTGVALRGYCDSIPGYLRGNVFDSYEGRRWRSNRRWLERDQQGEVVATHRARLVPSSGAASVPLHQPTDQARARFALGLGNADTQDRVFAGSVEIHGQPRKGPQTFLPAAAMWVEGRADLIGITPDGLIHQGLDTEQPWVGGVAMTTERELMTEETRDLLIAVSPTVRTEITNAAAEVCRGATSPQEKAERIAAYFQNSFIYSLTLPSIPRGVDPLVHFLSTKHAAHCEFFASASTLMMRTQGVPARYVTGYVMDEVEESQNSYVARNRNAHAWVEYYDDGQQRWLALESTPGRQYQTLDSVQPEVASGAGGRPSDSTQSVAMGWLRKHWGTFRSLRVTDALAAGFRVVQLPLLVGLVAWLWWRKREPRGDARAVALAAARRVMDRRLRRWGWTRRNNETLHQFADRLESIVVSSGSEKAILQQAELACAAQWYREHAIALYRPHAAVAEGV